MSERPPRTQAAAAITSFLRTELGHRFGPRGEEHPSFAMTPDGADCWAWWILADDRTSYVRSDLSIEWLGTAWEPGEEAS